MKVRMFKKCANPEYILRPGEVYHLPKAVGEALLKDGPFGPAAELVTDPNVKGTVPPSKPDPGDVGPQSVDDGEFEELEDGR